MENNILIEEYEKKLAELQTRLDEYKKEAEASISALKAENKAEIEKINERYREELRNVLSKRGAPEKNTDNENDDEADESDENTHESRIKRAVKKLKSKYRIGD